MPAHRHLADVCLQVGGEPSSRHLKFPYLGIANLRYPYVGTSTWTSSPDHQNNAGALLQEADFALVDAALTCIEWS